MRPRNPLLSACLPGIARMARAAALALLCGALAWPFHALDKAQGRSMSEAAQQASGECLHQMHHDTDEFSACVDARLKRSADKPFVQLGEAYLGLVGCLSAQRIATLHADICAQDYLVHVDRLRKPLRLGDKQLCPLVSGDCGSRIAQIVALRRDMQRRVRHPPVA